MLFESRNTMGQTAFCVHPLGHDTVQTGRQSVTDRTVAPSEVAAAVTVLLN
jgi:hypothetical protein